MKKKCLLTLVIGLVLGFAASFVATYPRAEAQQVVVKGPSWEYKVISALAGPGAYLQLTGSFNTLAADGWEYVGPIIAAPDAYNNANQLRQAAYSLVLLKRAKR